MNEETWKHISGLPRGYEVSSFGNIRVDYITHVEPIELHLAADGHSVVHLFGKTYKIHRLVAETFLPNPEHKTVVNHKDHDITNNHVDNLEWATYQENALNEWHTQKRAGKCVKCVETGLIYQTLISAEAHLGIPKSAIENSAKKHTSCFGLHFEYVESEEAQNMIFISNSQVVALSEKMSSIEEFRKLFNTNK